MIVHENAKLIVLRINDILYQYQNLDISEINHHHVRSEYPNGESPIKWFLEAEVVILRINGKEKVLKCRY